MYRTGVESAAKRGLEKQRTLFSDDIIVAPKTAASYGIRYILHKTYASSRAEKAKSGDFQTLEDVRDLMFLDNNK